MLNKYTASTIISITIYFALVVGPVQLRRRSVHFLLYYFHKNELFGEGIHILQ